jgi:hypothetical protein
MCEGGCHTKLIHSAKKRDFENCRVIVSGFLESMEEEQYLKKGKEKLVTQGMPLISAIMKKALLG